MPALDPEIRLGDSTWLELDRDGCELFESTVDSLLMQELLAEANRLETRPAGAEATRRGGVRNVLRQSPDYAHLAWYGSLRQLAVRLLGPEARPVRGILFDKTPEANWLVPMHQDLTIAVKERVAVDGYGPWSFKEGQLHVQPPARVLEHMLALRLHLDDCSATNGPLRVLPGTHRSGKLSAEQIKSCVIENNEAVCQVRRGDVLAMRPLLLHASSPALVPGRRRVLHVEYAVACLPPPLVWAEAEPQEI